MALGWQDSNCEQDLTPEPLWPNPHKSQRANCGPEKDWFPFSLHRKTAPGRRQGGMLELRGMGRRRGLSQGKNG